MIPIISVKLSKNTVVSLPLKQEQINPALRLYSVHISVLSSKGRSTPIRRWAHIAQILIVDDDPHIRKLVGHFLRREGFSVIEAANGLEALRELETAKADLVILDIMMPEMDGWELCCELRKHYDLPLLMLTAKGESAQKVKGFELGTDDYLVKPFDPPELIARVKALLKRYKIIAAHTVKIGNLSLNRNTYESRIGDDILTLPLKEFELLFKLACYPNHTFTRDQLIEEIWGYDYEGNERTVDVHINRLRDRFPESQIAFRISTIRGLGYRLEVHK
jgi:two-component system OmpR family response regulator